MTKQISFTKNASGEYEASFVSTGPVTVQIQRKSMKSVSVLANIPGMPPAVVSVHQNPYNDGIIFGIDLPVGIEVMLRTNGEIIKAMQMSND